MLRWVLLAVFPLCWAQVRTVVEISGIVVDAQGQPIPDVRIAYAGIDFKSLPDGTFRLSTSSPFVVFRHRRFASIVRRPGELKAVRIQLSPITLNPFRACEGHRFDEPIELLGTMFRLPPTSGVVESEFLPGGDSWGHAYFLETNRSATMGHDIGPAWSLGFPEDQVIWSSLEYSEATFAAGRVPITDARGTTADGKRWRFLGRFTETISYGPLPPQEAAIFDRAFDGVCAAN